MKNLNLLLFAFFLNVFQLSAQQISVQLSTGLTGSPGLIHPTDNGTDFTVQDALASTSFGIFSEGEFQMYFKKFGVGIMYSLNSTKLNEKDFKENQNATFARSDWIHFQSIMLQVLLRKNLSGKMNLQFSLAGGPAFVNESTHQMDFPLNPNKYTARRVDIQTASGGKVSLSGQFNYSLATDLGLFFKGSYGVIWMPTEVNFNYDSVNASDNSATFDLLYFLSDIGIGVRFNF